MIIDQNKKMSGKQNKTLKSCWIFAIKYIIPVYYLIYSKKKETLPKKVFSKGFAFIFGILQGIAFYELILVDLNFTENAAILCGATLCLMLAVGNTVSSQIRCISFLTLPSFCGRTGRTVLKAVILAYIISGPIENLTSNGKEVVRVFACTTTLTYNLTKTRFELMFKPFQEALFGMKSDANEIKDTMRSISDVSAPITKELENEEEMVKIKEENDNVDSALNESKRSDEIDKKYKTKDYEEEADKYERKYLKKIESRCENQLSRGAEKCKTMFANGYDKCYDTISVLVAWLLCWPMKLTFVCNIAESLGGSKICDPTNHVDAGLGEGYAKLKRSQGVLKENFKKAKFQYQVVKIQPPIDLHEAADTAKAVITEFKEKKRILESILNIVKRLLAFVFLKIIIVSQNYHDKYLMEVQFDNIYITRYFRKIDARRRSKEQHTLLPLKKIERKKLIDPRSLIPLKKERKDLLMSSLRLIFELITATTFILLDRLLYEILDLIRRHARIDYTQTGHHDMLLEVKGTGLIASLLRSVVKGFNIKKRIKVVKSNAECLPNPNLMSSYYLIKIYGVYIGIWIFIFVQAYTHRLQHIICAYFYPKREKKRILFIYNDTLKKRIGFFRYMKKKVLKMVREEKLEENLNMFAVLRVRYPHICNWLRCFKAARRKCIICKDPEPRKKRDLQHDFLRCGNPDCYVVYCFECWNDIGAQCLACASFDDNDDNDDSGLDDSDQEMMYNDNDD